MITPTVEVSNSDTPIIHETSMVLSPGGGQTSEKSPLIDDKVFVIVLCIFCFLHPGLEVSVQV